MQKFNEQTGHAIIRAAQLDNQLQILLLGGMPRMSNTLANNLFDTKGPLSAFSAKIDMARALTLIDAPTHRALHAIRAMRNEFAHAEVPLRFSSPEIVLRAKKFATWHEGAQARTLFDEACDTAEMAINSRTNELSWDHASA